MTTMMIVAEEEVEGTFLHFVIGEGDSTKKQDLKQWFSPGGVSGPTIVPSHEVATLIYST